MALLTRKAAVTATLHDGTSMIVLTAGKEVTFAEGSLRFLEKHKALVDEDAETQDLPPVDADGTEAPELVTIKVGDEELAVPAGYAVEAGESGWHTITGPDGFEARKVQGAAKLKAALADLPPVDADGTEAPPPA